MRGHHLLHRAGGHIRRRLHAIAGGTQGGFVVACFATCVVAVETALIRGTGGSKAPKASSGSSPLPLARPPGPFAAPAAKTYVSFPDAAMAAPWAGSTGRSNSTPRMGFPSRPVDPLQGASYPDLGFAISWPQTNSDLIRWEPNSIMFPSWPACPHKQNTETHQKNKADTANITLFLTPSALFLRKEFCT